MTCTTAIANQKGGVGKTCTAASLGVLLAHRDEHVLLIDTDPQATLSRQLGLDTRELAVSLVDVMAGRCDAADTIVTGPHDLPLDVLPAARELAGVEMALVAEFQRERYLANALAPLDSYGHIVIDCPPNLGRLSVNALVCADIVVCPVAADDPASVQGAIELRTTLAKIALDVQLVPILTRWQPARVVGDLIVETLRSLDLEPAVKIPARAMVPQSAVAQVPLAHSAPDSPVTLAYHRLVDQLAGERVS